MQFQSTHPVWDGTSRLTTTPPTLSFQSTHPVWDGTGWRATTRRGEAHFNPPIPCGMGLTTERCKRWMNSFQSTHPVWDGTIVVYYNHSKRLISIHPSRVGWDRHIQFSLVNDLAFQSTHPVWDGTHRARLTSASSINFNPPIPCGMGLALVAA